MYERFTDKARKVMALSTQEAQRFNHEYIGTEHILMGLVKEGSNIGAKVIKNMGLDLAMIREDVEKLVGSGPDAVTMGKLPQTPRVKMVIERAIAYAQNLGHNYVGGEHLVYALATGPTEDVACQVLRSLGVEPKGLEDEINSLLGVGVLDPEPISSEEGFWRIPKSVASIDQILKFYGYEVLRETPEQDLVREDGMELAVIPIENGRHCTPQVCYQAGELEQLKEAWALSNILDEQGVTYEEIPPRAEIVQRLRENLSETTTLADRMEGKQK